MRKLYHIARRNMFLFGMITFSIENRSLRRKFKGKFKKLESNARRYSLA